MFLSDPQRTAWDWNFRLFGIPVRVHPMFWLVSLMLGGDGYRELTELLIWVAAVFVSIVIHELGHALVIRRFGGRPWITLYGMGGIAAEQMRHRGPWEQVLISLAGPGAGFLFAAAIVGVGVAMGNRFVFVFGSPVGVILKFVRPFENPAVDTFVTSLLRINIFWGLVNLLPVYPLDGGQVSRALFVIGSPGDGIGQSMWLSIVTGAAVALYAGLVLKTMFMAIMFGLLAYENYVAWQRYTGRGGYDSGW